MGRLFGLFVAVGLIYFIVACITTPCFIYNVNVWVSLITHAKVPAMPTWVAVIGGLVLSEISVPLAVITWLLVLVGVIHPIL